MTAFLTIAIYLVGVVLAWGMARALNYKSHNSLNEHAIVSSLLSWAGCIFACLSTMSHYHGRPYFLFRGEPRKAKALPPVEDVYDFEDKPVATGIWR